MQIENEIEKTRKRINFLENQNAKFKHLLESTIEITKRSVSKTVLSQDENDFLQKTIELIEDEKVKLQEDLNQISSCVTPSFLDNLITTIKVLEKELKDQRKELENVKTEHTEIKFLLTHAEGNKADLIKSVLNLDNDPKKDIPSEILLKQRYKLQRKIVELENRRCELKSAIEDINNPDDKQAEASIKRDLETALFSAIDKVVTSDYEYLHAQVLQLEEERKDLLGQLQHVLNKSRREIAEEYCKLQETIEQIEREKATLTGTLEDLRMKHVSYDIDNKQLENILCAFRNIEVNEEVVYPEKEKNDNTENILFYKPALGLPCCTIL